jgi:hypothetical protein
MSETNLGPDPLAARSLAQDFSATPCNERAICWAAIFAGAAGAAALALLLVILGSGLGFSVVSPWKFAGISAGTLGVAAIAWLCFTQLAAAGVGGYLAGRLRMRWLAVDTDEVYFRDTAHGFLSWAVASLLGALVVSALFGSLGRGVGDGLFGAAKTAALLAPKADHHGDRAGAQAMEYVIDTMFRQDPALPAPVAQPGLVYAPAPEVARIFTQALYEGVLPQDDKVHIGGLITAYTGIAQPQAQARVSKGFEQLQNMLNQAATTAREAVDAARKASAYAALWMSVALLVGAFVASFMAVCGGRRRDC